MLARGRNFVVVFVAGLVATLSACDGSPNAPSAGLDLTGTWSGQVGQPGSTLALRLTWAATQNGNVVSGNATPVKPAAGVQARGVMTGILDGDRLVLTYAVSLEPTSHAAPRDAAPAECNRTSGTRR